MGHFEWDGDDGREKCSQWMETRPKQNETRSSTILQGKQHWIDSSDLSANFSTAMSMGIAFALLANPTASHASLSFR